MITTIKIQEMKNGPKFIYLPNELGDKLQKGRNYVIDIKIIELIESLTEYRCLDCDHEFTLRIDERVYCPSCGNEYIKSFVKVNI